MTYRDDDTACEGDIGATPVSGTVVVSVGRRVAIGATAGGGLLA